MVNIQYKGVNLYVNEFFKGLMVYISFENIIVSILKIYPKKYTLKLLIFPQFL